MFTKKHYINIISVLFLLSVNIIFLADFSLSRGISPWILGLAFLILFTAILLFLDKAFKPEEKVVRTIFIYLLLFLVLASLSFDFLINTGRGSEYFTAFNWLANMGNGVYPYNNASYHYNLPFLYYLDAPFYLLGDVRIVGLLGLTLFFMVLPSYSYTKKELVVRTSALLVLPVIYYEVTMGGDTFTNLTLTIVIIMLMDKYLDADRVDIRFLFFGFFFGALLCTRLIVVIPFMLSLLFFFRNNLKNLVLFFLLSMLICLALLVPYMRWDYAAFTAYGPLTNSLAHLPLWGYILVFLAVIYSGWMISDLQELFFASGLMIFFTTILGGGNENALSRMIASVPFFLLALKEYRIGRFTGKQLSIR